MGIGEWKTNYEAGLKQPGKRATAEETAAERAKQEAESKAGEADQGFFRFRRRGGGTTAGYGLKLDRIPAGLSQAPFKYKDAATRTTYDMTFNGGIVCVLQSKETLALEPVTGWAVLDHGELPA